MLAVSEKDIIENFSNIQEKIFDGETVIVSNIRKKNVIMLSEEKYNQLEKAERNAAYLAMLDESREQIKRGDTISFTMEELRAMESEDWEPTEKVLEFEQKHGIKRTGGQ